jgi:hypothetical protein
MDQQLARLEQQQAALQAELGQLTETLTSSKQANVVARAKVAAATSETAAELQAAQVCMMWELRWHAAYGMHALPVAVDQRNCSKSRLPKAAVCSCSHGARRIAVAAVNKNRRRPWPPALITQLQSLQWPRVKLAYCSGDLAASSLFYRP